MYRRRDEKSGHYGYWGRDRWVIDPQFDYTFNFYDGYAAVRLHDGHYGLITMDGAIRPLDAICGGRTPIREEFSFSGFASSIVGLPRYAPVQTEDGGHRQWGLIDTSLAYLPLPDDVFSGAASLSPCGDHIKFHRSNGPSKDSSSGMFNLAEMRLELPCTYWGIHESAESFWVVWRCVYTPNQYRSAAFYDPKTRRIVSEWFFEAMPFSEGLGAVRKTESEGWTFVDESLRPAFDGEFDGVERFSHGLAAVYQGSDAGYIDAAGSMRLLLPYDDLQPFNAFGLAIANRDASEWDLDIIDRKGKPRITGMETAVFWEGDFPYFEVTKNGKEQLLDMDLNVIFEQ